jgi:inner membrane protein
MHWRWLLCAVVAAVAADFDFIPGVLIGDANRYHQQTSHSIAAAIAFGGMSAWAARALAITTWKAAVAGTLVYGSHLLLDWLTQDSRPPIGIPLLWPFSDVTFHAPFSLFRGVRHGQPGAGIAEFLGAVLSAHNLFSLLMELALLLPLLLLAWWARARSIRRRTFL